MSPSIYKVSKNFLISRDPKSEAVRKFVTELVCKVC